MLSPYRVSGGTCMLRGLQDTDVLIGREPGAQSKKQPTFPLHQAGGYFAADGIVFLCLARIATPASLIWKLLQQAVAPMMRFSERFCGSCAIVPSLVRIAWLAVFRSAFNPPAHQHPYRNFP